MNIWTINQYASTPDLAGSQRTYQFAKAFAQRGNQVTLWMSSYSHWDKKETLNGNSPYRIKNEGNLKVIFLKTKPLYKKNDHNRVFNMFHFSYGLSKFAETEVSRPDIIIASYPTPVAAFAAYRISLKYNAKFVLEIRDLWPQVWVERNAFSRHHPLVIFFSKIERYLYKRAHILIPSFPYLGDYLHERGAKTKKILYIPNGIGLDDFRALKNNSDHSAQDGGISDAMKSGKSKGCMNVIYVGGLGPANRVDCILEAAKVLRDTSDNKICFHIVGEGHSRQQLTQYVSANKLDSVNIWPAIPRKAVPYLLNQADVGVLCLNDNPTYRYGVNLNKVYDYMAAGLPVVFSANVSNNLVDQAVAGITVQPCKAEEIADALNTLYIMSPSERNDMGSRGCRFVSENYDVKMLADKYLDFLT